jgi:hypothetical protein
MDAENNSLILEFIERRCKEIIIPKKRLRKNRLLQLGYIYGLLDTINILKKDSA